MSETNEGSEGRHRFAKKGPIVVWLFILLYLILTSLFLRVASISELPKALTFSFVLSFTAGQLLEYGPILLFLFLFVWRYEGNSRERVGIKSLFRSLGIRKTGVRRSILWSVVFLLLFVPVFLALSGIGQLLGTGTGVTGLGGIPRYYLYFGIVAALVTAITEETTMRGYILDRLMPAHPGTIRRSLNAILITSVLMSSYHVAPYLNSYGFTPGLALANLSVVFFSSIFISLAYVRSKARNVSGPVLFHFLADAGLYLIILVSLLV